MLTSVNKLLYRPRILARAHESRQIQRLFTAGGRTDNGGDLSCRLVLLVTLICSYILKMWWGC